MEKIVIVMPTFNEKENIGRMIDELAGKVFPGIKNTEMHLLVVDAKSPDGTSKVVKDKMKKYDRVHLLVKDKGGLGTDYVAGFKYAISKLSADAVMEMDADGQHPPKFVKPMVKAYLEGSDYVIGSRYIPGGSIPKEWGLSRKAMSYFGNLFIRLVWLKFNLHDVTTGFRLTKVKGVLDRIDLDNLMELKRFAYKVDLLHQSVKNAQKTKEVPLEFAPRTEAKSKFNIKEMISTFKVATVVGIRDKKRFFKFASVGFFGYLVNASTLWLFTKWNWPGLLVWGLSTEIAIISNFTFNNIWTFKTEKITGVLHLVRKFLQFNFTSAGALVIQMVAGTISDHVFGPQYRQLALPVIVVTMILPYNYFMYNAVIWKTWKIFGKKRKDKN